MRWSPFRLTVNANGLPAQVQRDELAKRLNFRETVEFLQAVLFVL